MPTNLRLALIGLPVLASCGPSFHVAQEADARFERCYALDASERIPSAERTNCWRTWMTHYARGQTQDRLAYAEARSKGEASQSTGAASSRPPGGLLASSLSLSAAPHEALTSTTARKGPVRDCSDDCSTVWGVCKSHCSGPACESCDGAYRMCMTACVRDERK